MAAVQVPENKLAINSWFERDRAHVELYDERNDKTIIEWWDDEVSEAIEDGFLDPRDYLGSAIEYAEDMELLEVLGDDDEGIEDELDEAEDEEA
jgi:hypothetical protein